MRRRRTGIELGRDLTGRGLQAPRLVVADGATGLIGAIDEIWPRADRQHSAAKTAPLYQATGENLDLARAAWAFAHGMIILELNRRLPPDANLDAAWRHGIDALRPVDQASAGARASSTAR